MDWIVTETMKIKNSKVNSIRYEKIYLCWGSSQVSNWSAGLPQYPHDAPSLLSAGFWLAQVPANFPSFFAQIFIAIPAKANANKPIVRKKSFIKFLFMQRYTKVVF